jgi:hypothetical protein
VLEAKQGTDRQLQDELPLFGFGSGEPAAKARKAGGAHRGSPGWAMAMQRARAQAEGYAKALPVGHGWPPFLVIVDVGHEIELFADFSLSGKNYAQFPDRDRFRVRLDDLRRADVRERLRAVWTDPASLDPGRVAARVTREIADHLGRLAHRLEEVEKRDPEAVAHFLMRCLFTMFAQNVGLLPADCFRQLLQEVVDSGQAALFRKRVEALWRVMNTGGFEPWLSRDLPEFNGGLFRDGSAFDLRMEEVGVLLAAAKADWKDVEPAIFGTLLERALDPRERHRLGAHFTPRAYVERLVTPTVIEPLREDWANVQAAALRHSLAGGPGGRARRGQDVSPEAVRDARPRPGLRHRQLPLRRDGADEAAGGRGDRARPRTRRGSGGARPPAAHGRPAPVPRHRGEPARGRDRRAGPVDRPPPVALPHPRSGHAGRAGAAELREHRCRDAILAWDRIELVRDAQGKPVTRWDGADPQEAFRDREGRAGRGGADGGRGLREPATAVWPKAEFVVGNPPFVGTRRMRLTLGDGYVETLFGVYPQVPRNADYVMFWWHRAAERARADELSRFGLITTTR